MTIRILSLAESDLVAAGRFYDRISEGIGSYFLETLYSDIESLRLFAGIHRRCWGYHRLLSRRFPFAIYYKTDRDEITIWRVLDCRRDPDWIRKELKRGIGKRRHA